MNEEYYIELISKYLSGNCSEIEKEELDKWKAQKEDNRKLFNQYEDDWKNSQLYDELFEPNIDKASEKFKAKIEGQFVLSIKDVRAKRLKILRNIAAVALILILSSTVYFVLKQPSKNNWIKITAGNEMKMVSLSDKSEVWLNKNSTISYPENFNKREIVLEGEAYFDVIRNTDSPFTICCNGSKIEVLGTSFNVKSDKEKTEVVVVSGKVSFDVEDIKDETKVFLDPGDKGTYYNKDRTIITDKNKNVNFLSWKDNCLVFDNTKLADVAIILSDHFNRQIEIESRILDSCRITTTFTDQNLEDILSEIEILLDIEINYKKNLITLSGNHCK